MKNINKIAVSCDFEDFEESKSRNGGSYYQPTFKAEIDGAKLCLEDSSCGDFGTRFFVSVDSHRAHFGTMENDENWYSDLAESDMRLLTIACRLWQHMGLYNEWPIPDWEWDWLIENQSIDQEEHTWEGEF